MNTHAVGMFILLVLASALSGCSTARLMEPMLGTSEPNEKILGQLFAVGGAGTSEIGADGVARIVVEHQPMQTVFSPAVIMMDRPGIIEITFNNSDPQGHLMIVMQSDGGQMALDLPPRHWEILKVSDCRQPRNDHR